MRSPSNCLILKRLRTGLGSARCPGFLIVAGLRWRVAVYRLGGVDGLSTRRRSGELALV